MHGDPEAARDRQLGGDGPAEGPARPAAGGRGRHAAGGGDAGWRPAAEPARSGDGGATGPRPGADEALPRDLPGPGEMSEPRWVSRRALQLLHLESLAEFGGAEGMRDEGLLDSALARPRNLHAYEGETDLCRLAAAYTA